MAPSALLSTAAPLAALTVLRYAPRAVPGALVRQGQDGLRLRRTPGLRFFRLLGTARGRGFGPWEPRRWAAFTVWESAEALAAFEAHSPVAEGWRRRAEECWTLRMQPLQAHGTWGGVEPFGPAGRPPAPSEGPLVVLTRATLRVRHVRSFRASAAALEPVLAQQEGLVASLAAGEVPYLRQATFSLWRSGAAVRAFAYASQVHARVVQRTRSEGWYREELFARLRPLSASGRWDGRDPFAELQAQPLLSSS